MREGTHIPDISTPDAFKQALLTAGSVAYTDPKAGGSGGIIFAALLQKLGIADAINKKAVLGKGGHDVAVVVAEGRAEIGTTFISEVLPVKGVRIVGTLPGELHNANTYTARPSIRVLRRRKAGMALLRKLTNATTRPRWTAAGLSPLFPSVDHLAWSGELA